MVQPRPIVFVEPAEWLGSCHPLVRQLDCAGALAAPGAVAGALPVGGVDDVAALRRRVRAHQAGLLLPLELPAICRAFDHTRRNQLRELLRFDRQLGSELQARSVAEASGRVGHAQLQHLRPLRDVRFVQRYLAAVERGRAHAWHTLVYGLTLAVFSLPLHQGLLSYARQTTGGIIQAAAWPLRLSEHDCRELLEELCASLPARVAPLARPATTP